MLKAIDFFCGAGGLTRGLRDAGIDVLAGVDIDARLEETYARNNKPSVFISQDIRDVEIHQLRERLGIGREDMTLYAACTPCQPFSTLNSLKGEDSRKDLILDFAEIVRQCPPDFILIENVPGLNNAYGKEICEEFLNVLSECGFSDPSAGLLDAKNYGVPQTRKRFILMASRHGKLELPVATHGVADQNRAETTCVATVRDHITKYPVISDGETSDAYPNHVARRLQPHHKRIVAAIPKNGGSRSDVADTSILLKCHQDNPSTHKDVFGRMSWDLPSPTLTCRCTDVYCGRFVHPDQDRGVSLREAAALQTFDDDYEFFGPSFLFLSTQIGNAVPVKFAEALGDVILQTCPVKGSDHEQ